MNWFATNKQTPIPTPDTTGRPKEWTVTTPTPKPSKTRPATIAQLFDEVAKLTDEDAVLHLRRNDHPNFRTILRYFLDERIEFQVEAVDYDINNWEEAPTLFQEANRLYLFCSDPLRPSTIADKPE